ncbi:MAG: TonB-dependent receptor [Planctomycetota bacterium]
MRTPSRTPLASFAIVLAACVVARSQDPAAAKDIAELRHRVDELEDQQAKLLEQLGGRAVVQAYTARQFDFGGHVTSLFSHMRGDDASKTGHVVSLLELYLKARIDDSWSVFATPGFYLFQGALPDDPTTSGVDPAFIPDDSSQARTFLSRLQAEWRLGDALQIRGGVIGSPHGTTNREYFIPARTIGQGSLHTRVFLTNSLYPQQLDGIAAGGKYPIDEHGRIDYDAYFGSQDDSPTEPIGGARLAYVFTDIGLSLAGNWGAGSRPGVTGSDLLTNVPTLQSPFAADFNGARDYSFGGIDVDWRVGSFIAKTELYYSAEDGYRDQKALSSEWTWFVRPDVGLSYRFDYYDRGGDDVVVAISPSIVTAPVVLGRAAEHVLGICYDPNPSVRLRLDFHHLLLPAGGGEVDFVNLGWSLSF